MKQLFILAICLLLGRPVKGQSDHGILDSVYSGFQSVYRFRFAEAEHKLIRLSRSFPQSPWPHLAYANYYWWLIVTGLKNETNEAKLQAHIKYVIELLTANNVQTDEYLYCLLSAYAIQSRVAVLNKNYLRAVACLNQSVHYLKQSFGRESVFPWFYLTSGMYNYYIEKEKTSFPLLYPYLIFLPRGDLQKGLKQIQYAIREKDAVLNTEARYFYFKILWEEDHNHLEAMKQLEKLLNTYPDNLLFRYYFIKLLLEDNHIEKAKRQLAKLMESSRRNHEVSSVQIRHFMEMAKDDLKKYYLRNPKETGSVK